MKAWIGTIKYYLKQFVELGVLLIADNIVGLVQSLGDAGIVGLVAAVIILGFYK